MTRLTVARIRSLKRPGLHGDGDGLYLHVSKTGARSWIQRITIAGRRRDIGLGGFPVVSLAEARQAALDNRKLVYAGGDPLALKRATAVPTFEEAAERVIALHRPAWRNEKHAAQWTATLRQYAFPRMGKRPVSVIGTADVMAVLMPIWLEKPETAKRVRQRISTIMKWAVAQGYRVDNPAGDAIGAALPKGNGNGKRHHRALPHDEVAAAIEAVHGSGAGMAAKLAFEFLILTAARSGEVRQAAWTEIDTDAAVWTVPATRMKSGKEHRVPLSPRALAILDEARAIDDGGGLVFPSPLHRGKPMSNMTLSKIMRELGMDAVPHGFRSSFRDWAAERTNAGHAVMEAALAHTVSNKVEAAYNRTDLFEKRRDLMARWADYLAGGSGKVVQLTARGR